MQKERPDPQAILSRLQEEEQKNSRGRLKVFFGACAGVGKTYSMLQAAAKLKEENVDVVIGVAETHGRKETEALLNGLEILAKKDTEYSGTTIQEFDIDAALLRKPKVILVDELAHTNAPGSRHNKRWQDVQELLEAGIDVYTTMNVQHLESLHDIVAQITRVSVKERVPDALLERADEIELVDLPPDDLLERMRAGKVYMAGQAKAAMENFFRKGNLIALRELALRVTAQRVVVDMENYRRSHDIIHPWPAADHVLVCVSPSPLSIRLVRAGKRMAEALRAKWTVIYVEGMRQQALPQEAKNRVVQTLRVAEQLGAQTMEMSGNNIPQEIIRYAVKYNVSKIIIGKPAQARWKEIFIGSVVDDVIRLSGVIDVYVITGDESKNGNGHDIPARSRKPTAIVPYVWTLLILGVCSGLAGLMRPYFELSNVVMIYLFGVVVIAAQFGRGPSILASILSVAAFDFFYVPPYLTFAVSDTQYLLTFTVMLVVALFISTLTSTIKQQAEASWLRETRTTALYSMSRELSSSLDMKSLGEIGVNHIAAVFESQVALYLGNHDGLLELAANGSGTHELKTAEAGITSWVHQNKKPAGLGTDTLPGADALYLPLMGAKKNIGVLVVRPAQSDRFLSPEQFRLLETFANQMAVACERAKLSEESAQAKLQAKTEQLRSSLLSSFSHDLRTPLATISGAASSILEGSDALDVEACKQMVHEIYHESMRLNRLVSNLLDMTKLQSGSLHVNRELQPVDEVIGASLNYMEEKVGEHSLDTDVPEDLPLINVDPVLIQQVLVNLIENAVKYSPPKTKIEVSAMQDGDEVIIAVADRGYGIKADEREKVFEKFYRADPQASTGAGLGLAICRGIVEAHGGRIWAEERSGGGSLLRFSVPAAGGLPEIDFDNDGPLE